MNWSSEANQRIKKMDKQFIEYYEVYPSH